VSLSQLLLGRSLPIGGLFLFLSACAHQAPRPPSAASPLACPQGWQSCLAEDLTALAQAKRQGRVRPWMDALERALRRSRSQDTGLILTYFNIPQALLDAETAERLMAALAVHGDSSIHSLRAASLFRRMSRRRYATTPAAPSLGEVETWWMVSGFESLRGAALARVDPPQRRFDPQLKVPTPLGDRSWKKVRRSRGKSLLYPQDWTFPTTKRCSHFVAAFSVPKGAQLTMRGGDERRLWLDGKPLLEVSALENPQTEPLLIAADLSPGKHQLEMRSCPRFGAAAFQVLVHDRTGKLLPIRSLDAEPRAQPLSSSFSSLSADQRAQAAAQEVQEPSLHRLLRAATLAQLGRRPDALALMAEVKTPNNLELMFTLSLAQRSRRKEQVMGLVMALGDDLPALVWRGQTLLTMRQRDRAAQLILPQMERFVAAGRSAQILVGSLLANQAPTGEIYRYWKARHEADPRWTLAVNRLAQSAQSLGKAKLTKRLKAINAAAFPGAADLLEKRRDKAVDAKDYRLAESLTKVLIAADDLDIGRRLAAVKIHLTKNDFSRAMELAEGLLNQNPYSPATLRFLADQYGANFGAERAAPYLARLAAVRPDHKQVVRAERFAEIRQPGRALQIPHWSRPSEAELLQLVKQRETHRPKRAVSQVLLLDDHLDLIQADGSRRQVVTLVRWFLDRGTAQKFLKINLSGLRNRQIYHAFLMQPDGSRVDPVSMRGGKIRFREIGPESVLVLQYESTRRRSSMLSGLVEGTFWFEGTDLYSHQSRYTLAMARPDLSPRFTVLGPAPSLSETTQGDIRVWSFRRDKVAPSVMERNAQAAWRTRSQVRFTTMESWDPYVNWVRDLFRQSSKVTPKVASKAAELVVGLLTSEAKIDAVYRYAVEEIQYEQDYARVIEGWEPHLPDQVLDRRYGDCKDKTMLIVTMLTSLGIQAHPALIRTWSLGGLDRKLPGSQFNHAVVYLPVQNGLETARFLDSTAEYLDRDNLRIDIQGTDALIITPKAWSFVTVPPRPADHEYLRVKLRHNGARSWSAQLRYRGQTAGTIRRIGDGEKQRFLMQSLATGLFWPGTELTNGKVTQANGRLVVELELNAPLSVLKRDGSVELPLTLNQVWLHPFLQSERKLPLRIGGHRSLQVEVRSSLGSMSIAKPIKSEDEMHRLSWTCEKGVCSFISVVEPLIIKAKDYASLAAAMRDFQAAMKDQKMLLKPRI
jgi:hypothetical protein